MKKYEFSENELSQCAFRVYSNSDFAFYKDADGIFYCGINKADKPKKMGNLSDIQEYLESFSGHLLSDMSIDHLKHLDGESFSPDDLVDIESNPEVVDMENLGCSGAYPGLIWHIATLTDGTDIDLYEEATPEK